jgi:hypothetical protein
MEAAEAKAPAELLELAAETAGWITEFAATLTRGADVGTTVGVVVRLAAGGCLWWCE